MFHQRKPREKQEFKEKESMQENKYAFMDAKEIAYLENQICLDTSLTAYLKNE